MRAAALALLLCCVCAAGRIGVDGALECAALGHAKCEVCSPAMTPVDGQKPLQECRRVQGGSLSSGAAEFLSNAITAIGAYFAL